LDELVVSGILSESLCRPRRRWREGVYHRPEKRSVFYFVITSSLRTGTIMLDAGRSEGGRVSDETHEVRGEAVPLNWACTVCGYHVEGELPEKCPDCGADREDFDEVPIPGF
jgi:rubredoxin